MSDQPQSPSDESEAQSLAAAAARRNRPVLLIAAAGLTLLVSTVFAFASMNAAHAARRNIASLAKSDRDVQRIAREIEQWRSKATDTPGANRYAIELQLSKLEAINERVELPQPPTLKELTPLHPLDSPIQKRRVDVTIDNVSLETAFAWINEAQKTIPDLFLSAIELRPKPTGWSVRIQVARWEFRP